MPEDLLHKTILKEILKNSSINEGSRVKKNYVMKSRKMRRKRRKRKGNM